MKKILITCLLFVSVLGAIAQKTETIYYDSNWKGVPSKELATYKRVLYYALKGSGYSNIMKNYFITGELASEGDFPIYIDKFDDSKSKWRGKYICYYKSGNKETEGFYNDLSELEGIQTRYFESGVKEHIANYKKGKLEGEITFFYENGKVKDLSIYRNGEIQSSTTYYENGNINIKSKHLNGKMNGTLFKYNEDGSGYAEVEMENDNQKYNYYTLVDNSGNRSRYDFKTNKLIQETPSNDNIKETVINGNSVRYYQMNGIFLTANISIEKVYGKYYTLSLMIGNNSNESFIFEADQLNGLIYNGLKQIPCKILSSDSYSKIVGRKQGWNSFFNALGEGMAASGAGTSTSSTTTKSAGYSNSAAIGADNSGNVAVAIGSTYGANTTTSKTTNYDGAAQYQANQTAQQNTAQYNNQLEQYRQALDEGYLKSNAIEPGKSISGYINIEYKKGDTIVIHIPVNGSTYTFAWSN